MIRPDEPGVGSMEANMNAEEVLAGQDFQKCVDFHGHLCPGLAIGYRAAKAGLDWLDANRSIDEEIVAVAENDACGCDAVQVLTGCTFGKGNFFHKDYGKMAFTFFGRASRKGIRVALKPDAFAPNERQLELMGKIRNEQATEAEQNELKELQHRRSCELLERPLESLFTVEELNDVEPPPKATVLPSQPCAKCGEPTMGSKIREIAGEKLCGACASVSSV